MGAAGVVGSDAGGQVERGQVARLGDGQVEMRRLNAQLAALDLWPEVECSHIDILLGGYQSHHLGVVDCGDDHVERLSAVQLKQLLQLELVVGQLRTGAHQRVLVLCHLGLQLCQIDARQTSNFHHDLCTVALHLRCFDDFLVHSHGLVLIEYLDIELCDLLLNGVGGLFRLEFGELAVVLALLDVLRVPASVPDRPVGVDAVTAVVAHLVAR